MLWGCNARTGIPGLTIMSPCILFLTIHLLCSGNSAQSQQTQCDSWRLSVALGVIRSLQELSAVHHGTENITGQMCKFEQHSV